MGEPTTTTNNNNVQNTADYLSQLLKDRKQLAAFPNVFLHVERLLDEEISKVRANLFQINGFKKDQLILPEPVGPIVALSEKVYVPSKEHPDFNFVGRILGPRGMTAKQLEQETGCKIMVRGRGSMRDKKKEEQNRGKPNWEHLSDELHVLITVEDTENRAKVKILKAVEEIKKLLVPAADGEDELKKRQLMELAIINGTYRDSTQKNQLIAENGELLADGLPMIGAEVPRLPTPLQYLATSQQLRSPGAPLGAPLILQQQRLVPTSSASLIPPPLITPGEQLMYYPSDYAQYAALTSQMLAAEYPTDPSGQLKQRRHITTTIREHPYQRTGALS